MVSFHSLTLSSFSVLFTPPLWKALSKTTAHLLFMHVHDPARVQKKKPLCLCYVTVSEGSRRSVFWYANERKYANERPHLDVNYSVAAIRISLMRHKVEEWKIGCLCKFEKIHLFVLCVCVCACVCYAEDAVDKRGTHPSHVHSLIAPHTPKHERKCKTTLWNQHIKGWPIPQPGPINQRQ